MTRPTHALALATALAWLLPAAAGAQQLKPVEIKEIEPTSIPRGKTTTITVTGVGLPDIQSALVVPPPGVKFVEIKKGTARPDGTSTIGIVLAVDAKAAPGERTLAVSSPGWDFELTKIRIQDHDIRIADLKAGLPGPGDHPAEHAPARMFSFTLFDDQQDVFGPDASVLGAVDTAITCGGKRMNASHTDFSSLGVSGSAAGPSTTPTSQLASPTGPPAAPPDQVPTQAVRTNAGPEKAGGQRVPTPPDIPTSVPSGNPTAVAAVGSRSQTVTFSLPEWVGKGSCEIRVSVKDEAGNQSNVLRLSADLK